MQFGTAKLSVMTAGNTCAWRAIYVYWRHPEFQYLNRKIFHIGIDPHAGFIQDRMDMFGSLFGREWRLQIYNPCPFLECMSHPGMWPVYRAFAALQCGLDGRYGWGRKRQNRG